MWTVLSSVPEFVPALPDHWRLGSLYHVIHTIARFNGCSAFELAKSVDRVIEQRLGDRFSPSLTDPKSFSLYWRDKDVRACQQISEIVRIALTVAQRDQSSYPLPLFADTMRWCPDCVRDGIHLGAHQSSFAVRCPLHASALITTCAYCGRRSKYRIRPSSSPLVCDSCGSVPTTLEQCPATTQPAYLRIEKYGSVAIEQPSRLEEITICGLHGFCERDGPCWSNDAIFVRDLRHIAAFGVQATPVLPDYMTAAFGILASYVRFKEFPQLTRDSHGGEQHHASAVLRLLAEVDELAFISGHSCIRQSHASMDTLEDACPCLVGFRLWLSRTDEDRFTAFSQRHAGISPYAFEAADLGLCLSMAWFSENQKPFIRAMRRDWTPLTLLDPLGGSDFLAADPQPSGSDFRVAGAEHRFQWLCIPCASQSSDERC